ncbi:MAG: hypothetical protein MUO51_12450 [Woeseiaceae bacterium]|nr:hypothetical protein [Woeseiaceae bacterium]
MSTTLFSGISYSGLTNVSSNILIIADGSATSRYYSDMSDTQSPLRLRKKHGSGALRDATAADGKRLVDVQSVRNAILAGLVTVIIFSLFWILLSDLTNRVFPWFTVALGFLVGYSVRLAGRGTDWRFPLIAAVITIAGALFANVLVAASVTAEGFDTGTLQILRAVTSMTWPVFFDEVLTIADVFFAVVAAGLAAFYANRRLTRSQYHAVRLWNEEQRRD